MKLRNGIIAALAAVTIAGAAAGAVATVGAQQDGGQSQAQEQTRRDQFLGRVADKLGVTTDQLKQAFKDAALDAVNEAEADGRITADQAAKARERIESGKGLAGPLRRHARHERLQRLRAGIINSAAGALGLSADELRAQLKSGDSIADVAAEQGVALDDVKAQLVSDAEAKAAEAVAAGKITQAQADEIVQRLTDHLDEILNKKRTAPAG